MADPWGALALFCVVVFFDDAVEDVDGLLLLAHLVNQAIPVAAELVHEEAGALRLVDHAGQDRVDVLTGEPGGEHVLDEYYSFDHLGQESSVP